MDRWKPKVDALLRLAAPDSGATDAERETATRKLNLILEHHSEAAQIKQYEPVRQFMAGDLARMKTAGISTDGTWTGATMQEAIGRMCADYRMRLDGNTALEQPGLRLRDKRESLPS